MKKMLQNFFLFIVLVIVPTLISSTAHNRYVLLTMLYNETNPLRIQEYQTCILKNKNHPLIKEIHVFYDTSVDAENNEILSFLEQEKIGITPIYGRATYGDFFEFAAKEYPHERIILCNADIYFNETLYQLDTFPLENTLIALTRWNVRQNGTLDLEKYGKLRIYDNEFSQDTWIFQSPLNIPGAERIPLGFFQCDSALAYLAKRCLNLKVINPCLSIKTCHLHHSEIRHYDKRAKRNWSIDSIKWSSLEDEINPKQNKKTKGSSKKNFYNPIANRLILFQKKFLRTNNGVS